MDAGPRAALVWLLGVSLALSAVSLLLPMVVHHPAARAGGPVREYLHVVQEASLPTWFATSLLLGGALVHGLAAVAARAAGTRGAAAWCSTALLLAALSLDDQTQLHERLEGIGRATGLADGHPFAWVVPGAVIAAVVVAVVVRAARALPRGAAVRVVLGICLLLGSAVGLEVVSGYVMAQGGARAYVALYHAEELGENLGALLVVAGALHALRVRVVDGAVVVRYALAPAPAPEPRHTSPAAARR